MSVHGENAQNGEFNEQSTSLPVLLVRLNEQLTAQSDVELEGMESLTSASQANIEVHQRVMMAPTHTA